MKSPDFQCVKSGFFVYCFVRRCCLLCRQRALLFVLSGGVCGILKRLYFFSSQKVLPLVLIGGGFLKGPYFLLFHKALFLVLSGDLVCCVVKGHSSLCRQKAFMFQRFVYELWVRYHSYRRAMPSCISTVWYQPREWSLETSVSFRIVPSGLSESKSISPP